MLSLPIPDALSNIRYNDITAPCSEPNIKTLADIVTDISRGKIKRTTKAHLDPDLSWGSLKREPHWRPILGQKGAAQKHLENQGITTGDIFLFFGLFRETVLKNKKYHWKQGSAPKHVIWGWLEVDAVLPVTSKTAEENPWLVYHCHFNHKTAKNNTLYVAKKFISLSNKASKIPGAGCFSKFNYKLQLTQENSIKTTDWLLPNWCFPKGDRYPLTYHKNKTRWQHSPSGTQLSAVSRGQEFVMDTIHFPESIPWLKNLLLS